MSKGISFSIPGLNGLPEERVFELLRGQQQEERHAKSLYKSAMLLSKYAGNPDRTRQRLRKLRDQFLSGEISVTAFYEAVDTIISRILF
jgi:hypothetical protein